MLGYLAKIVEHSWAFFQILSHLAFKMFNSNSKLLQRKNKFWVTHLKLYQIIKQ